jgi:hypothetical protein
MAWRVLPVAFVREGEVRKQLEVLHERMLRVIGQLQEVRAKVAETAVDVENETLFRRLRGDDLPESPEATLTTSS